MEIVPDEVDQIQAILRRWCDGDEMKRPNLIITSGGIYYIYINFKHIWINPCLDFLKYAFFSFEGLLSPFSDIYDIDVSHTTFIRG